MRNLTEFPITTKEVLDCLAELAEEFSPEKTHLCGDMRPLLLKKAIKIIKEHKDEQSHD